MPKVSEMLRITTKHPFWSNGVELRFDNFDTLK
jgi:hypothetical protein